MNAFVDMNAALALDANLGVDAFWYPGAEGSGLPVRLVAEDDQDEAPDVQGQGRKVMEKAVYSLDVALAAAVSPARNPQRGDTFAIGLQLLTVLEKPVRDQAQLNWLLSLA